MLNIEFSSDKRSSGPSGGLLAPQSSRLCSHRQDLGLLRATRLLHHRHGAAGTLQRSLRLHHREGVSGRAARKKLLLPGHYDLAYR
jgi:hypothetical protein